MNNGNATPPTGVKRGVSAWQIYLAAAFGRPGVGPR